MKRAYVWIKSHPLMTAGAVLALVLLWLVIRARGAASTAVATTGGPSEAFQLASYNAQTQRMGVQGQNDAQGQTIAAALASKQIEAASMMALAGLQRDIQLQTIDAQERLGNFSLQNQAAKQMLDQDIQRDALNVQHDLGVRQIDANLLYGLGVSADQRTVSLAGISASQTVSLAQIAAGLNLGLNTNATNLAIVNSNNSALLGVTQIQGGVAIHISDNELAGLRDTNATAAVINATNTAGLNYRAGLQQTVDLTTIAGAITINDRNATSAELINAQNNAVLFHGIDMNALVDMHISDNNLSLGNNLIFTMGQVANNQTNANFGINTHILDQIDRGLIRGDNIPLAISGVTQSPWIASSVASSNASSGSMWSNIFGAIGNMFSFGLG